MSNPQSFLAAAQYQRVCANCGRPGSFHAHHVVSKQALKKAGREDLLWDEDNALRLCEGLDTRRCHFTLEHGGVNRLRLPTSKLRQENICFIWKALGVSGQNYLERHYSGVDRRYTLHLSENCPRCQQPPKPPPA